MNTSAGVLDELRRSLATLLLCAIAALPGAAIGAGVAMVTDVQGKATASSKGRSRELSILAELEPDTVVQLGAGATLVALYLDAGDEYIFKGPATIRFGSAQPEVDSGSSPERRTLLLGKDGKNVRIKPIGVTQGGMVLRLLVGGRSADIQLLSPPRTRTLDPRPEFRWRELQPRPTYGFTLYDDAGGAVFETQVDTTSLKLPASLEVREGA